ncbi:DUF1302 domain-containing protein [Undibacterium sp. RuTC16W]|uniref:DUF1302 domain-containing protein n=1 Tax=Undibacterium sp. RuTC16W TaxID=3413048 RepID=UPI003BEFDBC8
MSKSRNWIYAGLSAMVVGNASAFDLETESVNGAINSNVTAGLGVRARNQSCALIGSQNQSCAGAVNTAQWANGDNGNLNYNKGDLFTGYLSLTSEALFKLPGENLKFLARATALYDPMAGQTKTTPLTGSARGQMVNRATMLDLWGQKDFQIGEQSAHIRVGKQVINWGESLFAGGGVNATNALDVQTLLIPGTQLKQALLPAPMISFATNLPAGFSTEAYLQIGWNANRYPAVGGYWSLSDNVGRGSVPGLSNPNNYNQAGLDPATALNYTTIQPGNKAQYGIRLGYTPPGESINFAAYYENYSDKNPVFGSIAGGTVMAAQYLTGRELFGLSVNLPLGLWSIGAEMSYRPRDAVAMSGCFLVGGPTDFNTNAAAGNCNSWKDNKKYQFIVNAQAQMSPTSHPELMSILGGAHTAILTAELSFINYPGIDVGKTYPTTVAGQAAYTVPAAGYSYWLTGGADPITAAKGTSKSAGYVIDFNWTYDGSLMPGWGVTPGVTFSNAFSGYTPSYSANYMRGAKSANLYLVLTQNPAVWQAGLNYTAFFGGSTPNSQPYADRNFFGAYVTRNF